MFVEKKMHTERPPIHIMLLLSWIALYIKPTIVKDGLIKKGHR